MPLLRAYAATLLLSMFSPLALLLPWRRQRCHRCHAMVVAADYAAMPGDAMLIFFAILLIRRYAVTRQRAAMPYERHD